MIQPPMLFAIASAAAFCLIEWVMVCDGFQICLRITTEDKLGVSRGVIVDQIIQLGAFVHVSGKLVFNGDTVDGEHGAVVVTDFDAGGVDVIFTGNAVIFQWKYLLRYAARSQLIYLFFGKTLFAIFAANACELPGNEKVLELR